MIYFNITNTFLTKTHTGIQRVAVELCKRFSKDRTCQFIVWDKTSFYILDKQKELLNVFAKTSFEPKKLFSLSNVNEGDIYVDIDGSWGDYYDLEDILKTLVKRKALIINLHFDAVPILYPQFSHDNTVFRYFENFCLFMRYADYWLSISETVQTDLRKIFKKYGFGIPQGEVIPLGADFTQKVKRTDLISPEVLTVINSEFFLSVGTIEPRKNYELLIAGYKKFLADNPGNSIPLVIVGREGWMCEAITTQINNFKVDEKHSAGEIVWLPQATDYELEELLKSAHFYISTSHYEGFGLPVIESLSRGCPTICTKNTAMEEVSAGSALAIEKTVESVSAAIAFMSDSHVNSIYRKKAAEFQPPKWDDAGKKMLQFLKTKTASFGFNKKPQQVVYISIRPESCFLGITSILENMAFIKSVVILTSDEMYHEFLEITKSLPIKITIISESALGIQDLPDDHQIRNTFLRRTLYQSDYIEDNFIAFDDDYIVVDKCTSSIFHKRNQHSGFYFYDNGLEWLGAYPKPTSFDVGIFKTSRYLSYIGCDTKLYNSHQPQIVNKKLAVEILDRTAGMGLDEWSVYFNIAKRQHPQNFSDQKHRSLFWPESYTDWSPSHAPENPLFVNKPYMWDSDTFNLPIAVDTNASDFIAYESMNDSVSPQNTKFIITREQTDFTCTEMNVPYDYKLYIPIHIESLEYQVSIKVEGRPLQTFSPSDIPRFIYMPKIVERSVTSALIQVVVTSIRDNSVIERELHLNFFE